MHGEKTCTQCLDTHSIRPALRYRCYRGSLASTVPMAFMIWVHRSLKTWESQIDAFITLTTFQKDILCAAGLPKERVFVKPHFYPNPPDPLPWKDRESKVLFIGRLGAEKGCHILLETWRLWGSKAPCLEVIGDGPERSKLEAFAQASDLNNKITFWASYPFIRFKKGWKKARLLVFHPSASRHSV